MAHLLNKDVWRIVRPGGTTYVRSDLSKLTNAYGGDKEALEALGWTFELISSNKPKRNKKADEDE